MCIKLPLKNKCFNITAGQKTKTICVLYITSSNMLLIAQTELYHVTNKGFFIFTESQLFNHIANS